MKKIYLTLLALIAFIGVQSASADAYTVFHNSVDYAHVWNGGQGSTGTDVQEHWKVSNEVRVIYHAAGFQNVIFKSATGWPSGITRYDVDGSISDKDLHMFNGAADAGVLKVLLGNGQGVEVTFDIRDNQVYKSGTLTMGSSGSQEFQLGFSNGKGWRMIPENQTLTVGTYQAIKRYDDSSQVGKFSMAAGSQYHFELNTANMQIKVVQDSAPETVTWYYQVDNGTKTEMNNSGSNWTISGNMTSGQSIKFFRNETQMGPTDGEYTLSTSQTGIPAGTSLVESTNASVKISMAGTFGFTITEGGADGSKISSTYTAPARPDEWFYTVNNGSKISLGEGLESYTFSKTDWAVNDQIRIYKNDTQMGPGADGDYWGVNNNYSNVAISANSKYFQVTTPGSYKFTIKDAKGSSPKVDIVYAAPLYLFYSDGKDNWNSSSALSMTLDDFGYYTKSISVSDGSYFVPANSTTLDWSNSANRYGAPSSDCPIVDGETKSITLGWGNVFYIANSGRYTISVNAERTTVSIKRTGDYSGGGNWEGAEDLNVYIDNKNNTDIINYITPSAGSAADAYSIHFAYTKPVAGKKLSQKLTASHTHSANASDANYVWMKYETLDWMGENGEGTNDVIAEKVPQADALYLSDTHMYENGPRGSLMATSKFMEELKCNSLAELIESRTHCVHHNEGTVHTPRNFRQAYYRVYGMHEVSPVAEMNSAKTLSANDRKIKAVVTPSHPSRYNARVAYTAEVEDNTSGVTGIEVDKDVIGSEDVAPVYYNLQGVKVSRPSAGQVYIVKRGDKVTKEIIK